MKNMSLKYTKKGTRTIVSHQDCLPFVAIDHQIVEIYKQKISGVKADKLCALNCKRSYTRGSDKPIYSFDSYSFIDKNETLRYDKEYLLLIYNNNIEQCERETNLFLNAANIKIPQVDKENSQSLDFGGGVAKLNIMDIIYLQNFRIFLRIEKNLLKAGLLYPHLDFLIQEVNILIRYASITLSKQLLNKDDNSLQAKTFGYLTLTQSGTILPLSLDDTDEISKFAIVGVWTYGEDITDENLKDSQLLKSRVWGLLSHFYIMPKFSCRFTYTKNNPSFLLINFNKKRSPKVFLFKISDKCSLNCKLSLENFNIYVDEAQGTMYKDNKTKVRSVNIDFSSTSQNPSLETSFHVHPDKSVYSKESQAKNFPQQLPIPVRRIQPEVKELTESDVSVIKYIREYQDKNEVFYRKTIEKMQDQISLLSQAIVSINQNLVYLNQKVVNVQKEHGGDTFILPDLTNSHSISESSNNIVFADDLKNSKTLSEILQVPNNKHYKRYKTSDVDIIPETEQFFVEDIKFSYNKCQKKTICKPSEQRLSRAEGSSLEFQIINDNSSSSLKKEENSSVLTKITKIYDQNEYNSRRENNASIPIPKINPKFKRYVPSSDSEVSDSGYDGL